MPNLLPPLCLLLALAMVVVAFAVWSVEAPEASVELHAARASGDEEYRDVLEGQLKRRQLARSLLIGCLFAGSAVMTIAAFASMRPAGDR